MPSFDQKGTDPVFNDALGYIYQLNVIRKGLIEARISRRTRERYDLLNAYWINLYPELERQDKWDMINAHETFKIKVDSLFDEWEACQQGKKKSYPKNIYSWFDLWEMRLGGDHNKLGLMMKASDDPSNAIGRSHF